LWAKLAVSATTAVVFVAYLRGGVGRRVAPAPVARDDRELLSLGGDAVATAARAL